MGMEKWNRLKVGLVDLKTLETLDSKYMNIRNKTIVFHFIYRDIILIILINSLPTWFTPITTWDWQ